MACLVLVLGKEPPPCWLACDALPCAVQALQRFQRRRVAAAAACAAALLGLCSAAAAGVSLLSPLPPVLLLAAAGAAVAYCRLDALIAKFVFTDYDHAMQH